MNLSEQLETALGACTQAGVEILKVYESDFSQSIQLKEDNSPLTQADMASNRIICDILRKSFPAYHILSEEGEACVPEDAEYCWVVDPLDGTKEFINRNGQFTVNIGLVSDHRVVLGVVAVPVTGEVFYAAKGNGAFKQSRDGIQRIRVSDKTSELIWIGSKSHSSEKEQRLIKANRHLIGETISAGSSLKGTMVAEGCADVYYRFGYTSEWDTCAMQCIVEEAGGIFRQMDSSEMLYNRSNHLNEKGFYVVNRRENIWV